MRRQQALEALITAAPSNRQQRLRGLQWRVDMERRKTKDPVLGCQKVFNMMWKSVYGDHGLLQALNGLPTAQGGKAAMSVRPAAKVLAFHDDVLENN